MEEETAFENGRISDVQGLVILTLDRLILHTVLHHLSTSTYVPNYIEIEETSCGQTDGLTYVQMDAWTGERTFEMQRPTLLGRLGGVDLNMIRQAASVPKKCIL